MFDVTQSPYNAVGDGVADDQPAIQAAIDDAITAGGGVVYLPAGTYLLASLTGVNSPALAVGGNNVYLRGEGVGVSRLLLADNMDNHLINFADCSWGGVSNLKIDQNGANQTAGHGIRMSGTSNVRVSNVYITDTAGYGIGLQGGTLTGNRFENILIENAGVDGFDSKNLNDNNGINFISGLTVRNFGIASGVGVVSGVDFRGPWMAENIVVENVTQNNVGIRFREGEVNDPSGLGGHNSTLNNFSITASSSTNTDGLIMNAYQCRASNGTISGFDKGVLIQQMENTVVNVKAHGCTTGFHIEKDAGLTTQPDRTILSACFARSNSGIGFDVESDYCVLEGVGARSNGYGIVIRSTANKTRVSGYATGNTTSNFDNNGTSTSSDVVT